MRVHISIRKDDVSQVGGTTIGGWERSGIKVSY